MTDSTFGIPDLVVTIMQAGHLAPSADNSQPWQFEWNGNLARLRIRRIDRGLTINHPAVLLSIGAVVENVMQVVEYSGLPSEYVRLGPFTYESDVAFELTLPQSTSHDRCDLPKQVRERGTNRSNFAKEPLPITLLTAIEAQSEDACIVRAVHERNDIKTWSRLVRRASSLRFLSKDIHEWFHDTLRFSEKQVLTGDGLDIRTLCLPPGGALLLKITRKWAVMNVLNKLGLHRMFAAIEGANLQSCGAVLTILGPAYDHRHWVSAGRLMQRVWLQLTETGYQVQPYFVIPDQIVRLRSGRVSPELVTTAEELAELTKNMAGMGDKYLYMMLRVGRTQMDPAKSLRRPLESIIQVVSS